MRSKVKSILFPVLIWIAVVFVFLILQLTIDDTSLRSASINEQINTLIYGVAFILVIALLQFNSRFPKLFETKWFVLHLIIAAFSYLIYDAVFVNMHVLPGDGSVFVTKDSSLGNELIDKVLGNGFGIYAIVLLIFSFVYKKVSGNTPVQKASTNDFMDQLKIKLSNRTYFIPTSSILFIKSSNNYSDLYTNDGKHVVRESISKLEEGLDPNLFARIHRSVIIRTNEVSEFLSQGNGDYKVKMKNQEVFSIGNKYKKDILERFGV